LFNNTKKKNTKQKLNY